MRDIFLLDLRMVSTPLPCVYMALKRVQHPLNCGLWHHNDAFIHSHITLSPSGLCSLLIHLSKRSTQAIRQAWCAESTWKIAPTYPKENVSWFARIPGSGAWLRAKASTRLLLWTTMFCGPLLEAVASNDGRRLCVAQTEPLYLTRLTAPTLPSPPSEGQPCRASTHRGVLLQIPLCEIKRRTLCSISPSRAWFDSARPMIHSHLLRPHPVVEIRKSPRYIQQRP